MADEGEPDTQTEASTPETVKAKVIAIRAQASKLPKPMRRRVDSALKTLLAFHDENHIAQVGEPAEPPAEVPGVVVGFYDISFRVSSALPATYLRDCLTQLDALEAAIRNRMWNVDTDQTRDSGIDEAIEALGSIAVSEIDHIRQVTLAELDADLRDSIDNRLARHRDDIERTLIEDARLASLVGRAREAAEAAEESAGVAGTLNLASSIDSFAGAERKQWRYWLLGTAALLLLIVGLAFFHISEAESVDSWIVLTRRLAVGLPLALAAGYSGREASEHRRHAMWLSHLSAQLKTLRAYSEPMSPEERDALRASFGRVVFAGPPDLAGSGGPDGRFDAPTLLELFRQLGR